MEFKRLISKIKPDLIVAILSNYLALAITFVSSVVLARTLGPELRGNFALISSYVALVYSMSSFNLAAGSLQAGVSKNTASTYDKFLSLRKPFLLGITLAFLLSLLMLGFFMTNPFSQGLWLEFFCACLASFLCAISVFINSTFVSNGLLFFVSIARFLGLAGFSIFVVLLFFFELVNIRSLLLVLALSTFINAVVSITLFFKSSHLRIPVWSDVLRCSTHGISKFIVELSLPAISFYYIHSHHDSRLLGIFIIAWGWSSLVDVFYPAVESKIYKRFNDVSPSNEFLGVLKSNVGYLVAFSVLIAPTVFLIPFIFGEEYREGIFLSLLLIVLRVVTQITNLFETVLMFRQKNKLLLLQVLLYFSTFLGSWLSLTIFSLRVLLLPFFLAQLARLLSSIYNSKRILKNSP